MDLHFLSNREWAIVIWVMVALVWVFFKPKIRRNLVDLIKTFCARGLLVNLVVWAGAWTSFSVLLLSSIGLWEFTNFKTTLIWFFAYAFVVLMKAQKHSREKGYFKKLFHETVSFTIFITFLADAYTFSIWAELVLLPVMVVVGALLGVAESSPELKDDKYNKTRTLLQWLPPIIGLVIIANSVFSAIHSHVSFLTFDRLRDLVMPSLLSILFMPFLYGFMLVLAYENVYGVLSNVHLRRYGIWKSLWVFKFMLHRIDPWRIQLWNLYPVTTKEEVDESIRLTLQDSYKTID